MREFFTDEGNGDVSEYQAWLQEHPDGRVLCLNEHGRDGKYIVHRSTCRTISYDTRSAGHDRSPMVCCTTWDEVTEWISHHPDVKEAGWKRFCPQCD
jgi:hypothetical protein